MCEGERFADDVLATRQEGLQQTSADLRQVITSCSNHLTFTFNLSTRPVLLLAQRLET